MQGDFEYSQLTFPTAEGMYVEEEKEDLSGIGDNLDGLLDVLPGKDAAAEIEAQSYADEIMLQVRPLPRHPGTHVPTVHRSEKTCLPPKLHVEASAHSNTSPHAYDIRKALFWPLCVWILVLCCCLHCLAYVYGAGGSEMRCVVT